MYSCFDKQTKNSSTSLVFQNQHIASSLKGSATFKANILLLSLEQSDISSVDDIWKALKQHIFDPVLSGDLARATVGERRMTVNSDPVIQ